jgi:tRNA A-37 threonylcarbamoyl transferase component Bud32
MDPDGPDVPRSYKTNWTLEAPEPGQPARRGGQGEVRKAVGKAGTRFAGQIAAVKFQDKNQHEDKARRARVHREVSSYKKLRHEGLPQLLDTNAEGYRDPDVRLYIATELIPGANLEYSLTNHRGAPLEYEEGLRLTLELARILAYVHSAGVIHRDIKPANIMGRDGDIFKPVLIDFGLAIDRTIEEEEAITHTGEDRGTRFFVTPESRGHSTDPPDERTDVAHLCAVLFYLLTLREPKAPVDEHQLQPHMRPNGLELLRSLPDIERQKLTEIFDVGFRQHRDDRFQSAEDLIQALREALGITWRRRGAQRARVVDAAGNADFTRISDALSNAEPGAIIQVRPGLYTDPLAVRIPVSIIGVGELGSVKVQSGAQPGLLVKGGFVTVTNIEFTQPRQTRDPSPRAPQVTHAQAAIDVQAGCLDITDSEIRAVNSCIQVEQGAEVRANSCRISGAYYGILLRHGAHATVRKSIFEECYMAGILAHSDAELRVHDTEFVGNVRGIQVDQARVQLSGVTFKNNRAGAWRLDEYSRSILKQTEVQRDTPDVGIRLSNDRALIVDNNEGEAIEIHEIAVLHEFGVRVHLECDAEVQPALTRTGTTNAKVIPRAPVDRMAQTYMRESYCAAAASQSGVSGVTVPPNQSRNIALVFPILTDGLPAEERDRLTRAPVFVEVVCGGFARPVRVKFSIDHEKMALRLSQY